MTDALDGVLALMVVGVLDLALLLLVRTRLPGAEGQFLARILLATLALRAVLAIFLNAYAGESSFAAMFWGDSSTYDDGGFSFSEKWNGNIFIAAQEETVSGWGFLYFVGAVYYVFGRNQLLVQLLNGTIGGLTVIVLYAIARMLFGSRSAGWTAILAAFFPHVVFWSGGMYKDPAVIFCVAASMYAVLKLRERLSGRHLMLFIAATLCLMTLRFYVFYFVVFATLGTFLFSKRGGGLRHLAAQLSLVGAFLAAFSFAVRQETIDRQSSYLNLRTLQVARLDQAVRAESGYGSEIDVSTWGGAVSAIPLGLVYLLFAPFPWAIANLRQMLTVPEMLVWYALMPSLMRGLRFTIRHHLRDALPILVFASALTVAYAIFQANVGTAYRQRTQVTIFLFVFIGVGLAEKKRLREGGRLVVPRPAA